MVFCKDDVSFRTIYTVDTPTVRYRSPNCIEERAYAHISILLTVNVDGTTGLLFTMKDCTKWMIVQAVFLQFIITVVDVILMVRGTTSTTKISIEGLPKAECSIRSVR